MRFYLFLLFFFSHHPFIFIINAYSTNNSVININLYQCNSNATILNTTIDTLFNNSIDSCNISCCTSNNLNNKTFSNLCQVSMQSTTGICLGRLCYSGECDTFTSLSNITNGSRMKNNTTLINQLHSSFVYTSWSSLVNTTQTKWSFWIDKTSLTIRHTIINILLIVNISLTLMALIVVIKSIRHANRIAEERSYRYTLL